MVLQKILLTGVAMSLNNQSLDAGTHLGFSPFLSEAINYSKCDSEPITLKKTNVREMAVRLQQYLQSVGVQFTTEGYPIIPSEALLSFVPNNIEFIPISRYQKAKCLSNTILIAYENDDILYRNLRHLNKLLPVLREAYGITGFDISPRIASNPVDQKFNILFSRLIDTYLALNGVRVLPNLRIGEPEHTLTSLQCYQNHKVFAVGMLGNGRGFKNIRMMNIITTIFYHWPSFIFFYGYLGKKFRTQFDVLGMNYRIITSYRDRCFQKENAYEC